MAYLKNWTDNFFQMFFDFNGVNVAKYWHGAGRGICHLWLPCCTCIGNIASLVNVVNFASDDWFNQFGAILKPAPMKCQRHEMK